MAYKSSSYEWKMNLTLIEINEVCEIAKLSKSTIFKKIKEDKFPAPIKVPSPSSRGPRLVNRWDKAEIIDWAFDDDVQELDDIKDEKLRVPYGDAFLEEARKGEYAGFMDWYDEPPKWWRKYSPHIFAIVLIVVVAAIIKFVVL